MMTQVFSRPAIMIGAMIGAGAIGYGASAQVEVNDGQTLTQADLVAGMFGGQSFTLGEGLVINVNDGGGAGPFVEPGPTPFSLHGATLNVRSGGRLVASSTSPSIMRDVIANIEAGATTGSRLAFGSNSSVAIAGAVSSIFSAGDGAQVALNGGSLGELARFTGPGTHFSMLGGVVQSMLIVNTSATAHVAGGTIGVNSTVRGGAIMTMTGGLVGAGFSVATGAVMNLHGGSLHQDFGVIDATMNLFVRDLRIGGSLVDLSYGEEFLVDTRGGALLEATLSDGSAFSAQLNEVSVSGQSLFNAGAVLTATLVPAPASATQIGLGCLLIRCRRDRRA